VILPYGHATSSVKRTNHRLIILIIRHVSLSHTHTHTHTQTLTHTHKHTHTHTQKHTHTHTNTYTYKQTHTNTRSLSLTHTHKHTPTYKHTHKHTLTHTHTNTHTHEGVSVNNGNIRIASDRGFRRCGWQACSPCFWYARWWVKTSALHSVLSGKSCFQYGFVVGLL
jgi:hypothetical protein